MSTSPSETDPRTAPNPAELLRDLGRCGWTSAEPRAPGDPAPSELYFNAFQGPRRVSCWTLTSAAGQRLMLLDLGNLPLPSPSDLFARFLGFSMEIRMALSAARVMADPDWLLLLAEGALHLYRMAGETLEQRAALGTSEVDNELYPALAALARGQAPANPTAAAGLPGAESLAGWLRLWSLQLAALLEAPTAAVERMIWKWIIMLQWARRTSGESRGGWGLRVERLGETWTVYYDAPSATEDLASALDQFDRLFPTRLFAEEAAVHLAWLRQLEESALADRLRAELLMHPQARFEAETVAWLFTDLAREQEGWRREVAGCEPVRRRFQHDGWTVYHPLRVEVGEVGLLAALRDTERLAEYLHGLNLYARQRAESGAGARPVQPDLFHPNPQGIDAAGELGDGLAYLFGEALRVGGIDEGARFGVGLTLLLKALALARRLDWPLTCVATLDRLFE